MKHAVLRSDETEVQSVLDMVSDENLGNNISSQDSEQKEVVEESLVSEPVVNDPTQVSWSYENSQSPLSMEVI